MSAKNKQKDQPLLEMDVTNESLDNKDAPLNTPEITIEQVPSTESTTTGSIFLNTKPQSEQMEVHNHTHTARKKFKHYAFKFFMLFLAVTAGFLTENLREHYEEHNRVK